jgi:hypothetical protein
MPERLRRMVLPSCNLVQVDENFRRHDLSYIAHAMRGLPLHAPVVRKAPKGASAFSDLPLYHAPFLSVGVGACVGMFFFHMSVFILHLSRLYLCRVFYVFLYMNLFTSVLRFPNSLVNTFHPSFLGIALAF